MAGLFALVRLIPGRLVGATFGVFGAGLTLGFMLGSMGKRSEAWNGAANDAGAEQEDYRRWSIGQLRNLAEQRHIHNSDAMSRQELVDALRHAA